MMWEEDDNDEFEQRENNNVEDSVESVDSLQPETDQETGGLFCKLYQ